VREQRDPPQRRQGPGDPAQLHHGLEGEPDQPPGAGEQQQGQRELDYQRPDEARRETARVVVKRHVEPRVADQQRAGDDHEEDDYLALVPGRPGGRGEAGQFGDVQPDPYAPPVVRGIAPGQGQDEDRDPDGQPDTARRHEQQAEPPAPAEPGIDQRVRPVNGGQGAGQLTPFVRGQPAKFSLIDHIVILRRPPSA
jgi:hypothetical protein